MSALSRRDALALGVAFATFGAAHADKLPDGLGLGPEEPFSPDRVVERARALAAEAYKEPPQVPPEWLDISYDQYRAIWFDTRNALWNDTDRPARLEFFAPGLYFPSPVEMHAVSEDGATASQIAFALEAFDKTDKFPDLPITDAVGYSGLRIHGEIEKPGVFQEYAVFQGASYFRAVAKGQVYGLSARGLAVNTAGSETEEFPAFRAFWIEAPAPGATEVTVHALLDSPSVAGAYRFVISPGERTVMDVEATLFPRETLEHVGIAAGTSMFLFDETNRTKFDDFRPAVHDSDGLLIENGAGERLWRPLANPGKLQVSSFVDDNPKGFGLMQRPRDLADYADLEAHYHNRPGLWVTPGEDWGKGSVTLVEIPADKEIYDNVVAYWRPREAMVAKGEYRFNYRLDWCDAAPIVMNRAPVLNTRMGAREGGGRIATVDFADHGAIPQDLDKVTRHISSNRGKVSKGILQRNPETGGVRLGFSFTPPENRSMELRAQLLVEGRTISEVWLYRWTA
ncbi:MAG: glucan biosynthesis protein G [Pseudomonadota bacterium]